MRQGSASRCLARLGGFSLSARAIVTQRLGAGSAWGLGLGYGCRPDRRCSRRLSFSPGGPRRDVCAFVVVSVCVWVCSAF